MGTNDTWDKIATSAPVNAQAAKQLSRGEVWNPTVEILDWYEVMPEMKKFDPGAASDPGFINFTGRVFGRLRVLGLQKKDGNRLASWVCRCSCGYFCTRKSKSLKTAERGGNSFVDRCGRCDYQRRLAMGWAPAKKKAGDP